MEGGKSTAHIVQGKKIPLKHNCASQIMDLICLFYSIIQRKYATVHRHHCAWGSLSEITGIFEPLCRTNGKKLGVATFGWGSELAAPNAWCLGAVANAD